MDAHRYIGCWLHLVVALLPASAGALQLTPLSGPLDARGAKIQWFRCLEYDPNSHFGSCLRSEGAVLSDVAAAGEHTFSTVMTEPSLPGSPYAVHQSEITPTSISGSGSITLESQVDPDAFVDVTAFFEQAFTIDEEAMFELSGVLRRPPLPWFPVIGTGFARFELCQLRSDMLCVAGPMIVRHLLNDEPPFEIVLDASGVLDPGTYYLRVTAGIQGQANGSVASYQFALALVPEPATQWLAIGGALVAFGLRRRSTR